MRKKACELCGAAARMFCESDQASLCWDCDEKVHSANFLVAKHTRSTICHVCHSPTPWKASGPSIGRTISVCGGCICRSKAGAEARMSDNKDGREAATDEIEIGTAQSRIQTREEFDDNGDDDDSDDTKHSCSSDDDTDDDEDCFQDDENQVVPWTSTPPSQLATTTSTSGEEEEESFAAAYPFYTAESQSNFKRVCDFATSNVDDTSYQQFPTLNPPTIKEDEEEDEFLTRGFRRPWKQRRLTQSSNIYHHRCI